MYKGIIYTYLLCTVFLPILHEAEKNVVIIKTSAYLHNFMKKKTPLTLFMLKGFQEVPWCIIVYRACDGVFLFSCYVIFNCDVVKYFRLIGLLHSITNSNMKQYTSAHNNDYNLRIKRN